MKIKIAFVFLILCASLVSAKSQTIKGRVLSTLDSEPIPGCNISIGSKSLGVTDSEGRFEIHLPPDSCDVDFTFIGYSKMRFKSNCLSKDLGDVYMFWGCSLFIDGPRRKGLITEKYEDGSIMTMIPHNKQLLPHGVCKVFYPDGKLLIEGYYKQGEGVGQWKYYKKDGKVIVANFSNGRQVIN